MTSIINHCRDAYGWTDDDTKDYLPGWEVPTEDQREELKDQETPWVYQNSVKLKNVPYVGTVTTYKGGGYVMLTRRDMCRTRQVRFHVDLLRIRIRIWWSSLSSSSWWWQW